MSKLFMDLLNDIKGEVFSTYRCLSSDIGNYALIGNIKHITSDNLNIYPIYSTFNLYVNTGGIYDEARYSIRIYLNGEGVPTINLVCLEESELINFCIDEKDNELDLYVSTTVKGGTITLYETEKSGFVYWENFNKFTMTEQSFTNKINARSKTIIHKGSININSENVGRGYVIKRLVNSIYKKMVNFINSEGKVQIGSHKDTDQLGDFNTSVIFDDNDIEIQLQAGGRINPNRNHSYHIGDVDKKFRTIHLNDGVVCARTSAPADPINGMSFFHATSKKWVTYYNGVWYSATGEVVDI